jgi:hypothetical protein
MGRAAGPAWRPGTGPQLWFTSDEVFVTKRGAETVDARQTS